MNGQQCFDELVEHLRLLMKSAPYSDTTTVDMEFILQAFAFYMKANSLKVYTPEIGELLIHHCEQELHVCESRVNRAKGIVAKLNRMVQGLDGYEALWGDKTVLPELPIDLMNALEAFITYCSSRGNKDTTIHYKRWICGRFLKNIADLGCSNFTDFTGVLVQTAFLRLEHPQYWDRIGPFLRFLFEHGYTQDNYSRLVLHRRNHTPHPTVFSPTEIVAIEESIDRSTASGIRNYAIVLLLSRYGIRSRDVAALTFENLDFSNNRIHFIQQKTGAPWENELFPEVKSALEDYIQHARLKSVASERIFITLMIPYKPLDSFAINTAVGELIAKSGVDTKGKRHGSRAFRSSLASNMINDKVSTEVVRRVLGHGTKYAIRHYAKIDMQSMRLCPLPVPEPSGTFGEILSWKGRDRHV